MADDLVLLFYAAVRWQLQQQAEDLCVSDFDERVGCSFTAFTPMVFV